MIRRRTSEERGQSMVELGIFGSLLLVVLGAMIQFGMNADYQQRAQMEAYRKAMWSAARAPLDNMPISVSHSVIIDKTIPDPTHPFAIGTASPASFSASSPTRSYEANKSVDVDDDTGVPNLRELPFLVTTMQGRPVDCPTAKLLNRSRSSGMPVVHGCTTAGFRKVTNVLGFRQDDGKWVPDNDNYDPYDRYRQIYGRPNVHPFGPGTCPSPDMFGACNTSYQRDVMIMDPIEGELINYETAVILCRQLMDPIKMVNGAPMSACIKECEIGKSADDKTDCFKTCDQPIEKPWYCSTRPTKYLSTTFENVFNGRTGVQPIKNTGIQPNITTTSTQHLKLLKTESKSPARVETADVIEQWRETLNRPLIYFDARRRRPMRMPLSPSKAEDETNQTKQWATPLD